MSIRLFVVGLSNGRIPWPLGSSLRRGGRCFIVYGALARAVRLEAGIAVAYWWGVRPDTVSKWRKRFYEEGMDGLSERTRSGRPRSFPPSGGC